MEETKTLRRQSSQPTMSQINFTEDQEILAIELDYLGIVEEFLASDTLKPIEQLRLREKVLTALNAPEIGGIIKWGYLMVLLIKYYPNKANLRKQVKGSLNECYIRVFTSIPPPKDEAIDIILFSCCYMIHWQFYVQLPYERSRFDMRFVSDVYHIVIQCVNGIFVSDQYVKVNTDKYFTKFLAYRNERKEKLVKKAPKKPESTFMGQTLSFPDVSHRDGGNEFAKKLHECFKVKKRINLNKQSINEEAEEPRQESISQSASKEIMFGLQRIQFNVNSVSPSMGQVLHLGTNQLQGERSKMVSHKMEKINEKELEVLHMLKQLSESKMKKKESKSAKQTRFNLIEHYELSVPQKEYFQRHPKVDPYMKSMLELRYVLQERPESLQQLPSSKDVRSYLNEQRVLMANVGQAAQASTAKKRIIEHLEKAEQERTNKSEYFGMDGKHPIDMSTAWNSQQPTQYNNEATLMAQTTRHQSQPKMQNRMNQTISSKFEKSKEVVGQPQFYSGGVLDPLKEEAYQRKLEKAFKLANETEDGKLFVYKSKQVEYNQRFDNLMNKVSTENKINDIIQSINIRKNMVNKQLQKKIHQL